MNTTARILDVRNLVVEYPIGAGRTVQAVSGVSFEIGRGETLGLVGESGCGKSSLARAVMQCPGPASGRVIFCGEDLGDLDQNRLRSLRPGFQMIFQDAVAALNPSRSVGETLAMPLKITGKLSRSEHRRRVREMMTAVGLDPDTCDHRPFQFSGGQCQRIQIARALMTAPKLLVCDEPVSSLDVSVKAQIINLLEEMRQRYGLALLFISHDLAVVKNVCDRVAVMFLGKLCEVAPSENLYRTPAHPYTAALLGAIPRNNSVFIASPPNQLSSETPSPTDPPSGCRYRTRCPKAQKHCQKEEPILKAIRPDHYAACHYLH